MSPRYFTNCLPNIVTEEQFGIISKNKIFHCYFLLCVLTLAYSLSETAFFKISLFFFLNDILKKRLFLLSDASVSDFVKVEKTFRAGFTRNSVETTLISVFIFIRHLKY